MIIPVILAGGMGTRLWPLSTAECPKQFLRIADAEHSLLQQTLLRAQAICAVKPIVVCAEQHRFLAAEQCRELGLDVDLIIEPLANNTTQAIALAAQWLAQYRLCQHELEQAAMLIMPADHFIANAEPFITAVQQLQPYVQQGTVGIFGIEPTYAATGYGYLQTQELADAVLQVQQFHEKPSAEKAAQYVSANQIQPQWLWNSGMFFWKVQAFQQALAFNHPQSAAQIAQACKILNRDLDFIRPDAQALVGVIKQAVDIALLEVIASATQANIVAINVQDSGWTDMGSWQAIHSMLAQDVQHNSHSGAVRLHNTSNSHIYNGSGRDIVVQGLHNCVVVDTEDALLVSSFADIGHVAQMPASGTLTEFKTVYRPWGQYTLLHQHAGFKIKHLRVKPGGQLSLQKHSQRSEHWVVVKGVATVIRLDSGREVVQQLQQNESTFIPSGDVHALANQGTDMLEIVEVQSGGYLGEDDIIRLKDIYGRLN